MFGTRYADARLRLRRYGVEESGEREKGKRRVRGFEAVEKEVHGRTGDERREERRGNPKQRQRDESEDGDEGGQCRYTAFHELLDVPALGDVVVLFPFGFALVEVFVRVLRYDEAVCRSG